MAGNDNILITGRRDSCKMDSQVLFHYYSGLRAEIFCDAKYAGLSGSCAASEAEMQRLSYFKAQQKRLRHPGVFPQQANNMVKRF